MTGLPTVKVELDDPANPGTWPYDITAYVERRTAWTVERGRRDEFVQSDPGECRMRLNNRDGRFAPGSAQYGIVTDQRIRVTETIGGTTYPRFTGYVQDWPVQWTDPLAAESPMDVVAIDRLSRFARRKLLSSLAQQQLVDGAVLQYLLAEPDGARSVGDTSGARLGSLTRTGTGKLPAMGADTGTDQTGAAFVPGRYFSGQVSVQALTFEVAIIVPTPTAAPTDPGTVVDIEGDNHAGIVIQVATDGTARAVVRVVAGVGDVIETTLTGPVVNDGMGHHLAITWAPGGTAVLYVDGVSVDTESVPTPLFGQPTWSSITIGPGLAGTVWGLAGYATVRSAATVLQHYYASGVPSATGETSDQRFTRLAGFAGLTGADLAVETGALTNTTPQALADVYLLDALEQVATSEGGAVFVAGNGQTVMQNRFHRLNKALGAPAVTLAADDYDPTIRVQSDKQFLRNDVTGSRVGGARISTRNQASINQFDSYPGGSELSDLIVTTDSEVRDRCSWEVAQYAQPRPRITPVTVDLLTAPLALVKALLALEIGDRMIVGGLPSQAPTSSVDTIVESIAETQSLTAWEMTITSSPAAVHLAWIEQDPTYGVLDQTTRLHY